MRTIVSVLFLLLSTVAISQSAVSGKFKVLNAQDPVSRSKVKTRLKAIEINPLFDQIIITRRSGADTIKVASVVKITRTGSWLFRGSVKGYPHNLTFTQVGGDYFDVCYNDKLIYKLRRK